MYAIRSYYEQPTRHTCDWWDPEVNLDMASAAACHALSAAVDDRFRLASARDTGRLREGSPDVHELYHPEPLGCLDDGDGWRRAVIRAILVYCFRITSYNVCYTKLLRTTYSLP